MNEQKKGNGEFPTRTYAIWILAGGYLLYTGYRLCSGVLAGEDGAGWGFFAAGIVFAVVGAIMMFLGGKGVLRKEKEKKEAQEAAQAEQQEQLESPAEEIPASEDPQEKAAEGPKKPMSIAERARLAEHLDEVPETGDSKKEE